MTSLTAGAPVAASALRSPWWVVVGSFLSLLLGAGSISYVFGVFLRPVTEDLGISRSLFSSGMLAFAIMAAVACPFVGGAVDRWGVRKVLLPLITGFAVCTAAFSLMTPSAPVVWALFAACGLMAVGLTPIPFARAISLRFDRHRGLALGLAIAAVGAGLVVVPPIVGKLLVIWDWRSAFVAYGFAVFVLAFPSVAFLIKDKPAASVSERSTQRAGASALSGMTGAEAIRSWRFWAMLFAFFLGVVAVIGTTSHTVPMLIDRGLSIPQAAATMSFVGVAAIASRIACGWMLDRYSGPRIAMVFFILPAVGVYLLASGIDGIWPTIGAVMLGLAVGAEVDMLAYFVGGYFGLRSFGKLYGCMFAAFSLGSGVGPFLSGLAFDHLHSYRVIFTAYVVMLVISCLLVSRLGAYPYPPRSSHH